MLANYNKLSQKLLFMLPCVEGVVQNLHFQVFIYVLNLFFQHDHPNSYDLFSSIDVYICVGHNGNQSGKGVKYRVAIQSITLLQIGQVSSK